MCAAVGGVKLADQGGFTRLHQNGGRHYLGLDTHAHLLPAPGQNQTDK